MANIRGHSVWHDLDSQEVLEILDSGMKGLTPGEIQKRRIIYGKNLLPEPTKRSFFSIFLGQFLNPLIYLLLLASFIAVVVGEGKDAIVILVVVMLNAIVGSIQEGRAEHSLESLRKIGKLQTRVVRDEIETIVEVSELVPGDLIVLSAGDVVPADARLIEATQLTSAEAALTGESTPVAKETTTLESATTLADRRNMLFAGTYIHSGRCLAVVVTTGLENEIGKIAKLAIATGHPQTLLERRTHQLGRYLGYTAIFVCLLVVLLGLLRGITFPEILMVAISQMVSLVPEGLPVAMTIALAVGVQRMAKRGTIVRKLSAIETLGSTTIICTDKTGTLTKNEMTVTEIYLPFEQRNISVTGGGYEPSGMFLESGKSLGLEAEKALKRLFEICILCNDAQLLRPAKNTLDWKILGDPTEGALLTLASKAKLDIQDIREKYLRIAEIPFDSSTKMMATQNRIEGENIVLLKGAPEMLINYSRGIYTTAGEEIPLTSEMKEQIHEAATQMADSALRVLAFAFVKDSVINDIGNMNSFFGKATFVGLVGQIDPPREEVAQAVRESQTAGIKTIMITGDHRATGMAIAKALGIFKEGDKAIDGKELELMSDESLDAVAEKTSVFARVHPTQKLRIVGALQRLGHVVAMTGDGVNDVPALVKADVGISMGKTGTDVAKESSKIIIADDNYATIVAAIGEGRLVYQNIKKLILFLFVTSIDEVLVLLLALFFGFPIPLAAVQILWINLVTEGSLTVNLIMEPPEGDELKRKPVPINDPLIDRTLLARIPIMVMSSVISTFGWFAFRVYQGAPNDVVQTETFTVLAVCQWFNVLNCRFSSQSTISLNIFKNYWLVGGLLIGNFLHVAVIYWEPLNRFFHTVPIAPNQFFAIGVVASLVLWTEEIRKYIFRKRLIRNRK